MRGSLTVCWVLTVLFLTYNGYEPHALSRWPEYDACRRATQDVRTIQAENGRSAVVACVLDEAAADCPTPRDLPEPAGAWLPGVGLVLALRRKRAFGLLAAVVLALTLALPAAAAPCAYFGRRARLHWFPVAGATAYWLQWEEDGPLWPVGPPPVWVPCPAQGEVLRARVRPRGSEPSTWSEWSPPFRCVAYAVADGETFTTSFLPRFAAGMRECGR